MIAQAPAQPPRAGAFFFVPGCEPDTFVKAGSSVAISLFADMLRIVGRSKEEALSLGSAP
jgi:hypothetical protein